MSRAKSLLEGLTLNESNLFSPKKFEASGVIRPVLNSVSRLAHAVLLAVARGSESDKALRFDIAGHLMADKDYVDTFLSGIKHPNLKQVLMVTPSSLKAMNKHLASLKKSFNVVTAKGAPLHKFNLSSYKHNDELSSQFDKEFLNISRSFRDLVRSIQIEVNQERLDQSKGFTSIFGDNLEADAKEVVAIFNKQIKKY